MILDNYYIEYSKNVECYSVLSYRNILTKFINTFIDVYKDDYKNDVYTKSVIYSKYYLFYKTIECKYATNIMEIIYNVEYIMNKNKK
jgi:hypothetical protein